ncbi:hypothetical protein [Sutcliffiella rhizosphaerae]|uniref:Uncharacterized protein n=1 Tax=Sutcliffiella rhizosphaerae TaxID=2880967 RepID=A0ABN8A2I6_9BACI|nr:hypothetical protein [Sutcliffiella rhizosphaerae]CAG9619359.1 hypothetical protein BACCIP111883_00126 [Sutcliffiella rhizosphaerae]
MEIIFDLLRQNPWLILILFGILSGLFRKSPEDKQQKNRQQQQTQQRQQKPQAARSRQEDYEDYRRESAAKPASNTQASTRTEEKPRIDWDVFGEGKLEELEQKIREKVNPYMEKVEEKRQQISPLEDRIKDEIEDVTTSMQDIAKDSPIFKNDLKRSEGRVANPRLKMNPDRVVEGVMWSEILGQPRARNPHRPVYSEYIQKKR